ncbi:arylformamidase [Shouchella lehensis]|uniref:Kynurenine formamidase n=1 Tax=Shouchella lehensis TaxID=300825 RepID=A0A4Y7WJX8_9BACI|nr:arylformamidase [Shouchella lehensis]MBG9785878.1 kynurenine formamidase [Shouchella lehensis]TES48348.1 arylformamidase [Shouchella lehensis]
MGWIDITMPLHNGIAHWPGDTPFSYTLSAPMEETGSVNIGEITTSTHTGTHADAPFHYHETGATIDALPLETYVGPALMITAIGVQTINQALLKTYDLTGVRRLLIKTKSKTDSTVFPTDIPYVTEDGANYLLKKGVSLLGVDVPSVDPLTSKDLVGHHSLGKANIAIIENLMLDHVEAGLYEFIALPLRIVGGDGSPVRAIIKPLESD